MLQCARDIQMGEHKIAHEYRHGAMHRRLERAYLAASWVSISHVR